MKVNLVTWLTLHVVEIIVSARCSVNYAAYIRLTLT